MCEWFDHAGDIGFEVRSESRKGLFESAARALMRTIAGDSEVEEKEETGVLVEDAVDREDLLVRFLSELLFLVEARHRMFAVVSVEELSNTRIAARARGERFDPDRHTIEREVKAVTYHGLSIEKEGSLWHARVILDL
jgi:SHS2 domain-containing protein